jgi:hypothetical protein
VSGLSTFSKILPLALYFQPEGKGLEGAVNGPNPPQQVVHVFEYSVPGVAGVGSNFWQILELLTGSGQPGKHELGRRLRGYVVH